MNPETLQDRMSNAALAFRGYNINNLGRSDELLEHPRYGPIVEQYLRDAARTCAETTGRKANLIELIRRGKEPSLEEYAQSVSLIVAMEMAQLQLLKDFFGIDHSSARLSYGYSLGEIAALAAGGSFDILEAVKIPLALSEDCVELAEDLSLGVFFSRGDELPLKKVHRLCLEINLAGQGVIGVSAYLSPNSILLLGQGDTIDRFKKSMKDIFAGRVYLRKNDSHWPPLHSPIVWQKHIPDRAAVLMHTMPGGLIKPTPPVLSLVSGKADYDESNVRERLHQWIDHPQRLWDAVCETLNLGIETVLHIGPAPNIIPATFKRLHDNVQAQTQESVGMRALSAAVNRPWLKALLPSRTALLWVLNVQQVVLEDWLLDQKFD